MNGSAAAAICYVAIGRFDAWMEAFLGKWDYSAAALIVQEAGGKLIDEMKSSLFILQMIIRQFCNDECIFDVFNVRHMNFFAIHKRFSAFPSIKTFIPANLINDA